MLKFNICFVFFWGMFGCENENGHYYHQSDFSFQPSKIADRKMKPQFWLKTSFAYSTNIQRISPKQ